MRRRELIAFFGGAAASWPLGARAQKATMPTVGWFVGDLPAAEIAGPDPANLQARAFLHGLRDLGWIEGRTVTIERHTAEGRVERAAPILAEMIARNVDVIFTGGADWLVEAASKATRTIPIVAVINRDPVTTGLVASLARPGGNLTGLTTTTGPGLYEKRFQLLRELAPTVHRIGFVGTLLAWTAYRAAADGSAVPHVLAPVDRPEDLDAAFATLRRERVDALLVGHGPLMFINVPRIVAFAESTRLPAAYPWREASAAGGLMAYGPNAQELFHQAAAYVDRILRGAKPAELPVEQPNKFQLTINLRTARALGIEVPEALLVRADEVIE